MKKLFIVVFCLIIGVFIVVAIIGFMKPKVPLGSNSNTTNNMPNAQTDTQGSTAKPNEPVTSKPVVDTEKPSPEKELTKKSWQWISTKYSNFTETIPKDPKKFILTFKTDGTFSASTDCNGIGGEYKVTNTNIVFNKMMSTMMYCEGSQAAEFQKVLDQSDNFSITPYGALRIDLKFGAGSATFQ